MANDKEAWDPNDPNYKAGVELGKAQKKADEVLKRTGGDTKRK